MLSNGKPQRTPDLVQRQNVLDALEQYEVVLTRYCHRLCHGDIEFARDVVQHAFLKLCQQPAGKVASVGPWLYTVCRNRIVDVIRSQGRQTTTDMQVFESADWRNSDPADVAEQADFLRHLGMLIQQLKGKEKDVIELWSQGFSHKEIAEILDRNPATVRVNLHRAIKQLKRHPEVTDWLQRASGQKSSPVPTHKIDSL